MLIRDQLPQYFYLMRLNKPIGILLLLWPTLWALWLAQQGMPDKKILFIFIAGVILTRSAGCIVNDFADRNIDKHVKRTRERPLTSGKVRVMPALALAALLSLSAFSLVLFCNPLTIQLAVGAAAIIIIYPFMKRFTHLPQLGLGAAFAWGVPMAFAAVTNSISPSAWLLFVACALWPVIYDTQYAMVDRDDDIKIGVKSTAILFADKDILIITLLQLLFICLLLVIGATYHLQTYYYIGVFASGLLFLYQYWLIKDRERDKCLQAFLNNNWVGVIIFLGIAASFLT